MTNPWIIPEPPTPASWTPEGGATGNWSIASSSFNPWIVEVTGTTIRITDDQGMVRITEQGQIRIIESMPFSWTKETSAFNPWIQE